MALLPSIQEEYGIECLRCSYRASGKHDEVIVCPTPGCGGSIREWYGRAVLMSAAGILHQSDEKDWFAHLVTSLEEDPDPHMLLLRMDSNLEANPDVVPEMKEALRSLYKRIPGAKAFADAELDNQFRIKGDTLLAPHDVDRRAVKALWNEFESLKPGVAFLDTSTVSDLTSLIIVLDESAVLMSETDTLFRRWAYVYTARIDVWVPFESQDGMINVAEVSDHLCEVIPRFPNLKGIWVDTRGLPWARKLVYNLGKSQQWGRRILPFEGSTDERNTGWNELEERILAGTIRYQKKGQVFTCIEHNQQKKTTAGERLVRELKDARKKWRKGKLGVHESNNRQLHLDLAENLSTCCYLVHDQTIKGSARGLAEVTRKASGNINKIRQFNRRLTKGIKNDPNSW